MLPLIGLACFTILLVTIGHLSSEREKTDDEMALPSESGYPAKGGIRYTIVAVKRRNRRKRKKRKKKGAAATAATEEPGIGDEQDSETEELATEQGEEESGEETKDQ